MRGGVEDLNVNTQKLILKLRPGEVVEVRNRAEIVATLDSNGTLEGLPFMPEMLRYCEKKFKVLKSFDKIFVEEIGNRRIKRTVILEGVLCDGQAHGGCQRSCYILWKEAWLKRVNTTAKQPIVPLPSNAAEYVINRSLPCQSAALVKATSRTAISLDTFVRMYVCDPRFIKWLPFRKLCTLLIRLMHKTRKLFDKRKKTFIIGSRTKTPEISLNLRPGERVQVKNMDEIMMTLDSFGKNKGLAYTPEMLKYCGQRFQVLRRITRLIDEKTGKMQRTANTVMLADVTCDGSGHANCPRNCFLLWREIWLKRV